MQTPGLVLAALGLLFGLNANAQAVAVRPGAGPSNDRGEPLAGPMIMKPGARTGRSARPDASTPPTATPQFSLAQGAYPGAQTVSITDATVGAIIYYTTNGAVPGTTSAVYSGPLTVSRSEVLTAVAIAPGYQASEYTWALYVITSVPDSFIYTFAGTDFFGFGGDGGPATSAWLNSPLSVVLDSSGNLFIADLGNNVVRKVAAGTGIITTIAGTGVPGNTGDGGPAASAQLYWPGSVAMDKAGNLYISDAHDFTIRKVAAGTGTISTWASNLNGLGSYANLAFDSAGNLYYAAIERIWKIDANTQAVTAVAGSGTYGFSGDGGPALSASMAQPDGIAFDSAGNMYIADTFNNAVRKVDASTGIITTIAGQGPASIGYTGDGGPATSAKLFFPYGVTIDKSDNIFILDSFNAVVREVSATTGIINTVVGSGAFCFSLGEDGAPVLSSSLCEPMEMSFDKSGNMYIAESGVSRIRIVTPVGPPPSTATAVPAFSLPAGTYAQPQTVTFSDTTPGAAIYVSMSDQPVSAGGRGNAVPADVSGSATVQAVAAAPGYLPSSVASASYTITSPPTAVISTVAGNGTSGFSGAGGPPTSAELGQPQAVVFDPNGTMYISDMKNHVVWKVAQGSGIITIAAGTGQPGSTGDHGPATSATLFQPVALATDHAGNLYISDYQANVVRMVAVNTGIITTVAGNGNSSGVVSNGDGGPAINANLSGPQGLAFDSTGNFYIADSGHDAIRFVQASSGIITTVAGGTYSGALGDGGLATAAYLNFPRVVALDATGNLLLAESGRVRKVTAATGIIDTVVGNGSVGVSGDGLAATDAEINIAWMAVDKNSNIYVADPDDEIRKVDATTGVISKVAGGPYSGLGADGISATLAGICSSAGLALDSAGSVYFSDQCANTIRKVTFPPPAPAPQFSLASGSYTGKQTVTITDSATNATIYYTTDGSTPTTGSTHYSAPITVSASQTLQAIAAANGYTLSPVASATYTITILTPAISLSPSAALVFVSNPVTFTATLSDPSGTPTGTATFFDGTTQLGMGTLAGGVATYTISSLAAGTHSITAAYSGDNNFSPTTSTAISETIEDFTIAVPSGSSSSATVSAGGQVSYTLAVSPSGGKTMAADITLAVSGLPAGATSSFSPATVTANSAATTVTLAVMAPSASAAVPASSAGPRFPIPVFLAVLLAVAGRRIRKGTRLLLNATLALFVLLGLGALSACGGGGHSSGGQPQTYTLNVKATSGALSHTTTLSLTVQ